MAYTPAQKRQYWAKRRADEKKKAANKKPFKPIATPSPFQVAVFDDIAHGSGDTVVEAVAGSGKSTTLLNGLLYIPEGKKVCFCAFGHDIAEELKDKCPKEGIDIATTHSFGFRAIKKRFRGATIDKYKLKTIVTGIVGDPYTDHEKTDEAKEEMIVNLSKCVSLCKQWLAHTPDEITEVMDKYNLDFLPEENRKGNISEEQYEICRNDFVRNVITVMSICKQQTSTVDFDDMLWLAVVLNLALDQFDIIFCDEVQDFNKCQLELIKRMRIPGGRIIACGDSRQAIFLFRGADQNSMNNLVEGLNAKRLPLSITYRCAKAVVQYVKDLVPGLDHLQAAETANEGVVNLMVSFETLKDQIKPGDFVISRLNAPNMSLAMYLLANDKPCNIRGRDLAGYFQYFIKSSKCTGIPEMMDYVQSWEENQINLLQNRKKKPKNMEAMIENIMDRSKCMMLLVQGCTDMQHLKSKINTLFSDDSPNKDNPKFISLGTTHKMKGLESDTCWMLNSTFKLGKNIEENNLVYVACTRSKNVLNVVEGQLREQ